MAKTWQGMFVWQVPYGIMRSSTVKVTRGALFWRSEEAGVNMIKVEIDSIRVSLMSQQRIVILKDQESDRYLPIWIGPCEADAITVELQNVEVARPLTHDLLRSVISAMGASVEHIIVSDLRNDVFYARVVIHQNGQRLEIDSRPSDAIALAVRVKVPIFVADEVMDRAAITPENEVEAEGPVSPSEAPTLPEGTPEVFKDFVDSLDMDDLGDSDTEEQE
jgi:bifunctional DNase/RNase